MIVIFRERAIEDLERIRDWIARDQPRAAQKVVERLLERATNLSLEGGARVGRPGREPGTRELVEPPHIIVYEIDEALEQIIVLAVFHGRQDR